MKKEKKLSFFGIGKILPYLSALKGPILFMLICGLLSSVTDVIMPLFQKYALNRFVTEGVFDTVIPFLLLYLLALGFSTLTNYISCSLAQTVEMKIDCSLRQRVFLHLQTLSFSYFNRHSVGYIHARLMSDTGKIGELFSWTLMDFVWRFSYLVGAIVVMFSMNARLTLLVLAVLPLLILLFGFFQKRLIGVNREIREINSRITGNFNEGIVGARTIKSLAAEGETEGRFCAETENMRQKSLHAARLHGFFAGIMSLGSSVALAVVLWKGGCIAAEEVGTFSVFMSYAQGMTEPVRWLVTIFSRLITTQVNIERLTDLLAVKPDVADTPAVTEKYGDVFAPKKENWEPIRGDIDFCDVTFRYPDGEENVLEHFSLSVPFGTHLALVGETGAGKSTLVNLVCRFYEPTAGEVRIDGRDVRERSQLWLHTAIGYVLQTPHLFSGTIRENLLMGKADATEEELWQALKTVSADGFVARLKDGLDTDVGEGGDFLSLGEKQLISFARAVLCDPRILILDEATASVDTVTEAKIQTAMAAITHGRTTLTVAHRLSTVKNADIILAVRGGKIVERGSHATLMQQRGYYYDLYTRQYREEETNRLFREQETAD